MVKGKGERNEGENKKRRIIEKQPFPFSPQTTLAGLKDILIHFVCT